MATSHHFGAAPEIDPHGILARVDLRVHLLQVPRRSGKGKPDSIGDTNGEFARVSLRVSLCWCPFRGR